MLNNEFCFILLVFFFRLGSLMLFRVVKFKSGSGL